MTYNNVPLSVKTKEIILGSLLGDGSIRIHPKYKNARFSFRHSIKQKEYFLWKCSKLKEISADKSIFIQKNDGYSLNDKLRYQSRALPALTELYKITHKKAFLIRRKWLNYMSALSLAIWWFDDGSIISNGRKGVICTDGFDEKSVKLLVQYLQKNLHIRAKAAPIRRKTNGKKKEYWRIWISSTSELKKLLKIILPYAEVEEMLYKIILLYNDDQLQQRWISEIIANTKFSENTVRKYVEAKKRKWKQFQKKI